MTDSLKYEVKRVMPCWHPKVSIFFKIICGLEFFMFAEKICQLSKMEKKKKKRTKIKWFNGKRSDVTP